MAEVAYVTASHVLPRWRYPIKEGAPSLEFSLNGGGEYRAVYIVHGDTVCVCTVFLIGAHDNIYKKAESRYAALLKAIE